MWIIQRNAGGLDARRRRSQCTHDAPVLTVVAAPQADQEGL